MAGDASVVCPLCKEVLVEDSEAGEDAGKSFPWKQHLKRQCKANPRINKEGVDED